MDRAWRGSPCPSPRPASSPSSIGGLGTVISRPGYSWVGDVSRFHNTRHQPTRRAAHSNLHGLRKLQGDHHPRPHPKTHSQLRRRSLRHQTGVQTTHTAAKGTHVNGSQMVSLPHTLRVKPKSWLGLVRPMRPGPVRPGPAAEVSTVGLSTLL